MRKIAAITAIKIFISSIIRAIIHDRGKPERAPHRSVVDVGGTSVACPAIYNTYMVVGWWYKHCMLNNICYKHGVWLVACPTIYFTNMEATISWTSSQGIELMASNEERLKRRRERDRLKRQTEALIICFSSIQEKTFPQKHLPPQPN